MGNQKALTWILRIGVAGEFLGHGMFAIQGKAEWIRWTQDLLGTDVATAATLVTLIGIMDIALAALVLIKPIRIAILWMALWGFWTALLRPLAGEPVWDFIERWANWAAPLALLLAIGWPRTLKGWVR